jgi:cation transport regulator
MAACLRASLFKELFTMPYARLNDLPDSVRDNLPERAQEIYKEAFNSAWEEYSDPADRRDDASREEIAHRVAWAAVKKKYVKNDEGRWVSISRQPEHQSPA